MTQQAGWEVEGFIVRLLERTPENDERLVLEACSHLREFSRQDSSLRDQIAQIREWQPIETAPLDGTPVLLFCPGISSWYRKTGMFDIMIGLWENGGSYSGWYSDIGDVGSYESSEAYFVHERLRPTHWMELPEPPQEV